MGDRAGRSGDWRPAHYGSGVAAKRAQPNHISNNHGAAMKINRRNKSFRPAYGNSSGFSLMELIVAIAVFLIISAAALSLIKRHVPLVSTQQNQAGLNITMRNALAQLQVDVVNAGTGYYQGVNIPTWPI